jgi:DNA repair exonuclease SbcCD ATPase subunit
LIENKTKLLLASFENIATILNKGEDCPLCGSKEHPYALNLPEIVSENDIEEKKK